jgi:multidrug efflux pump subunit AcrA (membrane-fusion protein)
MKKISLLFVVILLVAGSVYIFLRNQRTEEAAAAKAATAKTAYVYVTDPTGSVAVRPVVVNRTVAGVSVIASGLVPGEEVVADGQLRLKPGSRVKPRVASKSEPVSAGRP